MHCGELTNTEPGDVATGCYRQKLFFILESSHPVATARGSVFVVRGFMKQFFMIGGERSTNYSQSLNSARVHSYGSLDPNIHSV